MKIGPSLAAGIAAGYVLGRTRKMRLALTLAVAGATGKWGVRPSDLVQQRLMELASSDVGKAAGAARGELFAVAKDAVTETARSRIDDLADRLTSGLGEAGGRAAAGAGSAAGAAGAVTSRRRRRDEEPDEVDEPDEVEDEAAYGEAEDEEGEPEARGAEDDDEDREYDEGDEGEQEEGGRDRRRRPVARRSPSRRRDTEGPRDDDSDGDERPSRPARTASRRPARATASSGTRSRR